MRKLIFIMASSVFLGGCNPKDLFIKPPAGLEINTSPSSIVFINDENKGQTPFIDKNIKPGTYTLKLVPGPETNLPSYETKLSLISKASTIISRTFTQSELDSSGYTLQLQEDPSGQTYLSVISDPDTINVTLDDIPSGFTPLSKIAVSPGSHSLVVTSPGFVDQSLSINTVKGYNLIVNFKLAGQVITLTPAPVSTSSAEISSPTPSPTGLPLASLKPSSTPKPDLVLSVVDKPYVIVSDTVDTQSTKGLNVRKDPSSSSDVLGKATIGEKLKYLGETTTAGWHKVEFEGSPGWVSGKYATLVK